MSIIRRYFSQKRFREHLLGRHDQRTHGRKRSAGLFKALEKEGGFTYQPVTGRSPTKGYALSVSPEFEEVYDASKITKNDMRRFLDKHSDLFAENPDAYAGGWVDTEEGKVYLDVSIVVSDLERAWSLADKYDQKALYDLGKGETLYRSREQQRKGKRFIRFALPADPTDDELDELIKFIQKAAKS